MFPEFRLENESMTSWSSNKSAFSSSRDVAVKVVSATAYAIVLIFAYV
jgi:hypothetical protein